MDSPLSQQSDQIETLRAGIDVLVRVLKITDKLDLPEVGVRLSPPDTQALLFISQHPNCISGDLANHLAVAPTTATTIVDRLVRNDLVVRERTEANRRVVLLSLTTEGTRVIHTVLEEQRRHCQMMLEALPKDSRSSFVDNVERIASSLA